MLAYTGIDERLTKNKTMKYINQLDQAMYEIINSLWLNDNFTVDQIEAVIREDFHYMIDRVIADNLPY